MLTGMAYKIFSHPLQQILRQLGSFVQSSAVNDVRDLCLAIQVAYFNKGAFFPAADDQFVFTDEIQGIQVQPV